MPMDQDRDADRMNISLRPLAITQLENERIHGTPAQLGAKDLLAFVSGTGQPASPQDVVVRYKEISTDELDLIAVPAQRRVLEKVVWPLKSAKVCYCLGNYLACVAMCGLVGEMVAILVLEAKRTQRGEPAWPERDDFEKMGQRERIAKLSSLAIISKRLARNLKELQGIRRGYLHKLSFSHAQLTGDARKAYRSAFHVVQEVVGVKPSKQTAAFQVDPDILRFVKTQTTVRDPGK